MTKNFKFFLVAFILSLPFWWGANILHKDLEEFLYWEKLSGMTEILGAQMASEKELAELKPIKKNWIKDLDIEAKSAFSVLIKPDGTERILFEKNSREIMPIASLTKLMTASVVLDHYNISETRIKNELFPLLIRSNNASAIFLAEIVGKEVFIDLMNSKAESLGMKNSFFINSTGLDPEINLNENSDYDNNSVDGEEDNTDELINLSTSEDLVKLARHITENHYLIWEISKLSEYGNIVNTNQTLNRLPDIIGGKTGTTLKAGRCLLLVIESPNNKGYIINIVLNSKNRFEEMEKLVDWIKYVHKW